jgi:hypothetical protein
MTDQQSTDVIPWYQSKILQALIVSLITQTMSVFHVTTHLTNADIGSYVDTAFQVLSFVSIAWAGYHRVTKPTPPLVATQSRADQLNSTPPQ